MPINGALHEVAHGLEAVVTLLRLGDQVSFNDGGLTASVSRPGVRLKVQTVFDLAILKEGIADLSALPYGIMGIDEYLGGKYEANGFGYPREGRAAQKILATPVGQKMIRANFALGIKGEVEALDYVEALQKADPGLLQMSRLAE